MKKLVVKDNALINASYSLTLAEQRLILLAILEARHHSNENNFNEPLFVSAASYAESFEVEANAAYKSLKKASSDLLERRFTYGETIDGKIVKSTTRWVSEVGYAVNDAFVKIRFAQAVIPLITELERQFTSYELSQVAELTSSYAVRLYEILIAWRSTKKVPRIEIQDLRDRIGVLDDEYPLMERFKAKVLLPALEQINKHTDIIASYDQHKTGRKITAISFSFKFKENQEKTVTADSFIKLSPQQISMFSNKLAQLPELGSQAPVGASIAEYADIIAANLNDKNMQSYYAPLLAKVGYKASKKKAS